MPYEVMYVEDGNYVSGTLNGDLSASELNSARDDMDAALRVNDCRRLLVDATGVPRMQSITEDFKFTAEHQSALPLGTVHAVVIRPEHAEHMGFVETVAQNRSMDMSLFTDRAAAVDWLQNA